MSSKEILHLELNNVELINSGFKGSALQEARGLLITYQAKKGPLKRKNESEKHYQKRLKEFEHSKNHLIFSGRKSFLDRIKGNISREELKERRLQKLCSIGQCASRGNGLFSVQEDFNILFKPTRKEHITLEVIESQKKRYSRELKAIYIKSFLEKKYPVTCHLSFRFRICLFDF